MFNVEFNCTIELKARFEVIQFKRILFLVLNYISFEMLIIQSNKFGLLFACIIWFVNIKFIEQNLNSFLSSSIEMIWTHYVWRICVCVVWWCECSVLWCVTVDPFITIIIWKIQNYQNPKIIRQNLWNSFSLHSYFHVRNFSNSYSF